MDFLNNSMMMFDAGAWAEAKRLAVTVRTLVHNSAEGGSKSLLCLLDIQKSVKMLSFGCVQDSSPSSEALLSLRVETLPNGMQVSKMPLDAAHVNHENTAMLEFEDWWTEAVIKDTTGRISTRKDIVLLLANREGGAHADFISRKEINASTGEDFGWSAIYDSEAVPIYLAPHVPTMRTIAQEIYMSLEFKLNSGLLEALMRN